IRRQRNKSVSLYPREGCDTFYSAPISTPPKPRHKRFYRATTELSSNWLSQRRDQMPMSRRPKKSDQQRSNWLSYITLIVLALLGFAPACGNISLIFHCGSTKPHSQSMLYNVILTNF